ncbi:MAG: NAD(P)-binding domain-containing protein [Candidatus Acidiferrales bacterium]
MDDITVIVGAGPHGLSLAAHLRSQGIAFRIFGRPMDSWLNHMPKGMMLKSDGFASNLYDPEGSFTLKRFCADRGIEYAEAGAPIRLETFAAYGLAFKEHFVPDVENKLVESIERVAAGFILRLDTGETVAARKVVLAVGITHFEYVPSSLSHLPQELVTHSFHHHDLDRFRGQDVTVIGGGASATDLAGLLHENGSNVRLIARRTSLVFHTKTETGKRRSLWQRIRYPSSGLGPGIRSRLFSDAPQLFRYFPERLRLHIVRTHLGPSGGWFARDKVMGHIPLLLGYTVERADALGRGVKLELRGADGATQLIETGHVIAATGYKVDVGRLRFLSSDVRSDLRIVDRAPVLTSKFESSVPGLYFIGLAAANTFGPLLRFAYGAQFAARQLSLALAKSGRCAPTPVRNTGTATLSQGQ